jgi:hypothetical protein
LKAVVKAELVKAVGPSFWSCVVKTVKATALEALSDVKSVAESKAGSAAGASTASTGATAGSLVAFMAAFKSAGLGIEWGATVAVGDMDSNDYTVLRVRKGVDRLLNALTDDQVDILYKVVVLSR